MKKTEIEVKNCIVYEEQRQTFWCPFLSVSEDGAVCHFYANEYGEDREVCDPDENPGKKPDFCKVKRIIVEEEA